MERYKRPLIAYENIEGRTFFCPILHPALITTYLSQSLNTTHIYTRVKKVLQCLCIGMFERMKDVLFELNKSVNGVIGSFIIDENGEIAAIAAPELMVGPIKKVSKTLHRFTKIIKTTRSVDKLSLDAENARLISIKANGRLLVVIAEKRMNKSIFNIMSYLAVAEIKDMPPKMPEAGKPIAEEPVVVQDSEVRPAFEMLDKAQLDGAQASFSLVDRQGNVIHSARSIALDEVNPGDKLEFYMVRTLESKTHLASYKVKEPLSYDHDKICDLYDQLFGVAAQRVVNLIGPKSGVRFAEGADNVLKSYPDIFDGIDFGPDGKPNMRVIREKAGEVTNKDKLIEALDEMLLSMFETLKTIAGPRQEQKAREALDEMLGYMKKNVGTKPELKSIDSIQKIRIERAGVL